MANYTITVSSESEYVGPPLYVIYSTSMQPNITMQVGDTLTVTYIKYAGGQSSVTINNWDSGLWNDTSSIVLNDGDSVVRTATSAGTDQIVADFPSSSFPDRNRIVTIENSVVDPDTSVTFSTNSPVGPDATSYTLSTSGAGSVTTYEVRTSSYAGTIIKTFTGSVSNTTVNHQPSTSGTTYYVTAYVSTANGGVGTTGRQNVGTFSVTRSIRTYSLTGPASVDEGSPASMSVTTTNVDNNTTLYWTTSSDFNPNSGTVVISSNSGSFNVTPIADSTSEGDENHIVYLRTGSTSGTIVAQRTIEVIDTSINSGSGGNQGGGTATYGVEIYDANAVKILSVGDVLGFIVGSATVDIARNSSSGVIDVAFPGLKTTDIPFTDSGAFPTHNLSLSIPAANTMRVQYFLAIPPLTGTTTYELLAINLGD